MAQVSKPTQPRRHIAITTPLGEAVLLLKRFAPRERLSAPFEIEAESCCLDPNFIAL